MDNKNVEIKKKSNAASTKLDIKDPKLDKSLIEAALKRHNAEKILDDEKASIDILVALISSRYDKKTENNMPTANSGSFFGCVRSVLGFIVLILCLALLLGLDIPKHLWPDSDKAGSFFDKMSSEQDPESVSRGKFDFKSGKALTAREYFGKEDLFKEWHNACMKCIRGISEGKTKEELEEYSIYTKMNYALFGPPGTGKTFFVQAIAKKLDYDLKKEKLEEDKDPEYKELKTLDDASKLDQYIKKQPSRIWFCEVQAADINGKYVGESEGNVKKLFAEARDMVKDKKWKACILFFDEGDIFFNKRASSYSGSGQVSENLVKSELLTKIGVACTKEYLPVFVFTATNRIDEFDPAFMRRFHHQSDFGLLDFKERFRFLKFLLEDFSMTDDELRLISSLMNNRPQSFISEKINNFVEKDLTKGVKRFFYKEFVQSLRSQQL